VNRNSSHPGRRRLDDRKVPCGNLLVLHTGVLWEFLPRSWDSGRGRPAGVRCATGMRLELGSGRTRSCRPNWPRPLNCQSGANPMLYSSPIRHRRHTPYLTSPSRPSAPPTIANSKVDVGGLPTRMGLLGVAWALSMVCCRARLAASNTLQANSASTPVTSPQPSSSTVSCSSRAARWVPPRLGEHDRAPVLLSHARLVRLSHQRLHRAPPYPPVDARLRRQFLSGHQDRQSRGQMAQSAEPAGGRRERVRQRIPQQRDRHARTVTRRPPASRPEAIMILFGRRFLDAVGPGRYRVQKSRRFKTTGDPR
jgi:hypothetical protein